MILSRALAVIFGLQCASGYRHEMHLKTRSEASSNKSTQHGGASGDTRHLTRVQEVWGQDWGASLTCETGLNPSECEGSNDYYGKDSFKYISWKCCTRKFLACEEGSSRNICEGEHGEGKKKGWKFFRSEASNAWGKCCLVTDSQVSLTCQTGLQSHQCEELNEYHGDTFKYIGFEKCCSHPPLWFAGW
ncbi:unnamed protein product [Symbiodinium microadriaticum]|nr:unnamed protein product [Symbiodinium microadriaticum]CAE7744901.1 unnamed protein product [Symbiodinium sp. KB8]